MKDLSLFSSFTFILFLSSFYHYRVSLLVRFSFKILFVTIEICFAGVSLMFSTGKLVLSKRETSCQMVKSAGYNCPHGRSIYLVDGP